MNVDKIFILSRDLVPDLDPVMADGNKLHSLISNLAIYAQGAMPGENQIASG